MGVEHQHWWKSWYPNVFHEEVQFLQCIFLD